MAALLSFGVSPANGLPASQVLAIKKAVTNVPIPELAPKAADVVHKAPAKDREEVAITIVRTIVSKKPALATAVVESIAKVAPETATAIAAVAAELCPEQAAAIAKVAASAAPEQARQIAAAVAKANPKAALPIARMVIAADPIQSPQILESIVAAVPAAKAQIESDVTLNLMSILARNSRASAATSSLGKSGSKPLKNPFTSPPTIVSPPTNSSPRSAAVQNALKSFTSPTSNVVSSKLQSDIAISIVNTLNAIGRSTDLDKPARDAIINSTVSTVQTVLANSSGISDDDKTKIVQSTSKSVATIVSDTKLDSSVKSTYINFVTDTAKNFVADPTINKGKVDDAVNHASDVLAALIIKNENKTSGEALAGLENAKAQVDKDKNQYGSP